MMEGPWCRDSEEKHEPVSDINTVVADSLKALDPEWPTFFGATSMPALGQQATLLGPTPDPQTATIVTTISRQ